MKIHKRYTYNVHRLIMWGEDGEAETLMVEKPVCHVFMLNKTIEKYLTDDSSKVTCKLCQKSMIAQFKRKVEGR